MLPPVADSAASRTAIRAIVDADARKLVVLDDDPTGTQTVHGVMVLTEWSVPSLVRELRDSRSCFYILTNSRAMEPDKAANLNRKIAENLRAAARDSGRAICVVSRSDSTLRGHFPLETDVLTRDLDGELDGVMLIPAFIEGERVTVENVHYVVEAGRFVPVAETEFARDATFGYQSSDLREWIEEKTDGRVAARDVECVSLEIIRAGGAEAVRDRLLQADRGRFFVVNAATYEDLEIFVHGLLLAEGVGRRYLFRTAASFVRVRAAITPRGLLTPAETRTTATGGGLVIVGSYVEKTTRQLREALTLSEVSGIELQVGLLASAVARETEIARVASAADVLVAAGTTALVFTSRERLSAIGVTGDLRAAGIVSAALVEVTRRIRAMPRFIVAKGGITSSDLAVKGLGVRRALVLGQAAPGVPVWQLGAESRFPGVPYVVFPGNVGTPQTLRELLAGLLL
jgi:uncharacterized protein YgbK (DUF1537 family)